MRVAKTKHYFKRDLFSCFPLQNFPFHVCLLETWLGLHATYSLQFQRLLNDSAFKVSFRPLRVTFTHQKRRHFRKVISLHQHSFLFNWILYVTRIYNQMIPLFTLKDPAISVSRLKRVIYISIVSSNEPHHVLFIIIFPLL